MQKKSVLFLIIFLFISEFVFSQTQTPIYLSQVISNANSKGFYQYLPAGYSSNTKNYPLIIWVNSEIFDIPAPTTDFSSSVENEPASLFIYPNPAKDNILITIPNYMKGKYSIAIIDMQGKTVWMKSGEKGNNSHSENINISGLRKGIYILQLRQQQRISKTTIIKL